MSKSTLYDLYIAKGLSARLIAKKYDCWNTTVIKRLNKYGIALRHPTRALRPDRNVLHDMYLAKKLSPYTIARRFGCDPSTIRHWVINYGFPVRKKRLIKIPLTKLKKLYYKERQSLKQISDRFNCTPSGLFGVFKKNKLKLRTYSESSKFFLVRSDFNGTDSLKAYLIGFRLGDLHIRKRNNLIGVGSGTTKIDQLNLFQKLFNKFGRVYVGNKDKKGAWHPEVNLNQSFTFLLPKHTSIPSWITRSKLFFLNFFAGYVDAEGNIGCYPRARLKITSYDYKILNGIAKCLKKYLRILPVLFLEKTDRETHSKDALSVIINKKNDLLDVLSALKPLLRHSKRKRDLSIALVNINSRLRNRTL